MKNSLSRAVSGLVVMTALAGCKQQRPDPTALVLATTTSTYDTGLLDALIPPFEKEHDLQVKVVAVGTGEALEMGRRGTADVMMVHAPKAELALVEEGHALDRRAMMWNDFVVVGPNGDPLGLAGEDASAALATLAVKHGPFVSRGDDSGTHKKERALLEKAGVKPGWLGYVESGQGMAMTLRVAHEKQAYCLTDRGTYLALKDSLDLVVVVEGDPALMNPYHVMRLNPKMHPATNAKLAEQMLDYLVSEPVASTIRTFGVDRYGEPLFHPGVP